MASCSPTTTDQSMSPTISTVHPDIVGTHILTRLDGQTLAAAACTSSQLHSLCTQERLWQKICTSTWPSANDPRVETLISDFSAGHRSFFSDSFPVLDCQKISSKHILGIATTELISAVDIYYKNKPIFSKVAETETVADWFQIPPLRIDLVDTKDLVPTTIPFTTEANIILKKLEEKLTLSWIIIDSCRKRAVNLSSRWPVTVKQDWLTRDVQVKYAAVIAGDQRWGFFSRMEFVECEVMVILGANKEDGGEMYVKQVTMQMKDMDGRNLSGRDSLVILEGAMENGKRIRGKRGEGKERHEKFLKRKKERKERIDIAERVLNNICLATVFVTFVAYLSTKFA